MPRRNLIPFALCWPSSALLTLLFAVLGASSAPSGATLTVQNASGRTFGSPTGSTSFAMDLVDTLSAAGGEHDDPGAPGRLRAARTAWPSTSVGTTTKLLAVLEPGAITCALSAYTRHRGRLDAVDGERRHAYTRTESLADYSARVPTVTATSCAPQPDAPCSGQVTRRRPSAPATSSASA